MLRGKLYATLILVFVIWFALLIFVINAVDTATIGPTAGLIGLGVFIVGLMGSMFATAFGMLKHWDKKCAISPSRQRALAFGQILLKRNGESFRIFKLRNISKGKAKSMLRDWWGIRNRDEALHIVGYLSAGQGHTSFADDVYEQLKDTLDSQKGKQPKNISEYLSNLKEENVEQVDRINAAFSRQENAVEIRLFRD